jgi:hypothetical protein
VPKISGELISPGEKWKSEALETGGSSLPPFSAGILSGGEGRSCAEKRIRRREGTSTGMVPVCFSSYLIVGLNVLDSFFTMIILECGGWEVNPVVRSAIEVYGDQFWIWKFMLVSVNLILLCLHSRFRYVHRIISWITLLFLGVILYQIILLEYHIF